MPRQHPGRSLWNGMDSRTSVKELLVAQNEQAATGVCQVLWYMCSIQGSQDRPFGLLQPLSIPNRPWGFVAMDFITDLPIVRTKNSILVMVDRFTKMAHFTPCSKSIMIEETTQLILDGIVRLHGLPEEIVSDRGPQFASKFWRRLFELLGVDIRLFSAFHPETDGQIERTN
jgi:transposase InsO family protein